MSADGERAKFTTGSTMRHVIVMTMTASVGLVAIFMVDALNLFYISLLGEKELAAAIGYAGTLQFFLISTAIGMTIGAGALVAKNLGAGAREEAARDGGAAAEVIFVGDYVDRGPDTRGVIQRLRDGKAAGQLNDRILGSDTRQGRRLNRDADDRQTGLGGHHPG